MLRAAIFDMDGLLIDSEPLWRRTEVEVFAEVGLVLSEAMCEATTGLRIDEVVAHWRARRPWEGPSVAEVAERIVDRMIERVRSDGSPLPGVASAIAACRAAGLRLAIASSSPARLIDATIERLGLAGAFEVVVSAQHERFGKPHPAVFLTAADQLGVAPTECVILEDSVNGLIAAKAARASCVVVPAPHDRGDRRLALADRVLASLEELDAALLRELASGAPARLADHALTILAVEDLASVAAFHRRAFGWPTTVETPVYVELALPRGQRLGIYQRESFGKNTGQVPLAIPGGELAPTELYVYCDALELTIARLRELGARELSPLALRPWGDEAAYFADPAGNVIVVARRA